MRHGGFFRLFIIFVVIGVLMDLYVHQGLRTLLLGYGKNTRRIALGIYWLVSIGVTLWFLLSINNASKPPGMKPYHQWALSVFLGLLLTKVVFILVLFIGDIYRLFAGLVNSVRKSPGQDGYIPSRRKFVSEVAVLLAAVPFTSFLYAMFKGKYDYRVHKQTLYFDDLPEAFDGFTITQLSDIHSGSFDNAEAVQRGIDLANAQKSDLFVFTGDLVNNVATEIEPYMDRFSQLKAPYGQYSILGNHDYGDYIQWNSAQEKAANLQLLKKHHQAIGFRLLLDEHLELEKNGQKLTLVGVQNWGRDFIKMGNLDKALHGADPSSFKILLSHDPTHWEEIVRYHSTQIHLTLSGHTHGAQFGVETNSFRWSPVKYTYLNWAGLLMQNNRYLYVNRGFGFLAFSGRLGIWPEITVMELKRKA